MREEAGQAVGCPGCSISVRLSQAEIERIMKDYFRGAIPELAQIDEVERRLALCAACPDLRYGSTCAHCGCLVELRSRLAAKGCPSPIPHW